MIYRSENGHAVCQARGSNKIIIQGDLIRARLWRLAPTFMLLKLSLPSPSSPAHKDLANVTKYRIYKTFS